jgi:hypothetical protein
MTAVMLGTVRIAIPDTVTEREYDTVCAGAPTW